VRSSLLPFLPLAGVAFLTAVAVVAALVPGVRAFALRIGAVQEGGSGHGLGRRRHDGSIPSVGGMAIVGGFLIAVIVGALVAPQALGDDRTALLAIVLGGVLMTLLGLLDDLWELPVPMRLAVQTVAAGILVANGVRIDFVTNYFAAGPLARWAGEGSFLFFGETLAAVLTLLWVVGFTNAFNFIDGDRKSVV